MFAVSTLFKQRKGDEKFRDLEELLEGSGPEDEAMKVVITCSAAGGCSLKNINYMYINIYIYTWNLNDPCFCCKRPSFGKKTKDK